MKRYWKTILVVGGLVTITSLVSWAVLPEWRGTPGGFVILVIAALTGILGIFKGLKDAREIIEPQPPEPSKSALPGEKQVVEVVVTAPLTPYFESHSTPLVYHNLPQPDYGQFIGREKELSQVNRILLPYPQSQHSLVTIDGIGGVGKSALALEVAYRYLQNYESNPEPERFKAIVWTSAKQSVVTAEDIKARGQSLRTLNDIYTAIAVT